MQAKYRSTYAARITRGNPKRINRHWTDYPLKVANHRELLFNRIAASFNFRAAPVRCARQSPVAGYSAPPQLGDSERVSRDLFESALQGYPT
jgi:hypothetical protein